MMNDEFTNWLDECGLEIAGADCPLSEIGIPQPFYLKSKSNTEGIFYRHEIDGHHGKTALVKDYIDFENETVFELPLNTMVIPLQRALI